VQQKLPQLLADDTEPRFSLSALLKDLRLSRDAAQSIGVNLPVLEAVVPKAESAEEHGLGNRDYIVLALDRAELQLSPQ
jgi:3-hydroxyisobutyrate dehydrogenase-like beta-hydroxyacid dehydrogenase